MEGERLEQLAREVDRLKATNRRWRGAGLLAAALGSVAIFTGQGKPTKTTESDVFIGNSFNVRGKGEKFRASLEVNEKGTFPVFTLSDNKERIRFMIGLEKDGEATISFFDKDGKATKVIASDSK